VVLFGAGASHLDGGYDRPHLTRDLFDSLHPQFPDSWGRIPPYRAKDFADHFESAMDEIATDSKLLAEMTIDMALYFSSFRPRQIPEEPYYKIFIRCMKLIRSRKLVFATLNYDCLIELAAEQAGLIFLPYYFKSGDGLRLLKLHGSCNFPVNQDKIHIKEKLTMAQASRFESVIEPCHPREVAKLLKKRPCFPPAMALITPGKQILSCDNQIRQLQNIYAKTVTQASHVAIVGARPNRQDDHVWGPIARTKARVAFIGSAGPFNELSVMREGKSVIQLGEKFEDSVDDLLGFLIT